MSLASFWVEQVERNSWVAECEVGFPISRRTHPPLRADTFDGIVSAIIDWYGEMTPQIERVLQPAPQAEAMPSTVRLPDRPEPLAEGEEREDARGNSAEAQPEREVQFASDMDLGEDEGESESDGEEEQPRRRRGRPPKRRE
jgi:hypothetical protein